MTCRALLVGCLLGVALAASNVYVGLKIGIYDAGAITAAILGFAVLSAFGSTPSPRETNVLVTSSAAAAMMAGASGLIGPLAAMAMLGHGVSSWMVVAWSLALGILGVMLALPLRAPLIAEGRGLPFPTARATAEVIESIALARSAGPRRLRALLAATGVSAVVAWFRDGRPSVIPGTIAIPGDIGGHRLESLTVSISVSPLLLSAGALIGARNGISLALGSVVAWLVLAPMLVDAVVVASVAYSDVVSWLIWPGAALLVASTTTSLMLEWRTIVRGARELGVIARASRLHGTAVCILASIVFAVGWGALGLTPAAVLFGIVLAPVLAAACARAAGETDIPPVGPLGGVAQIAAAPLVPHNPVATLGAGAIVNGVAAQTSQAMYAFRTGQILGSSSRALIAAQLIGVAAGTLVVVPVYELLVRAYGLGSELLPAGAPLSWKATAEAVSNGIAGMPDYAPLAALIAAGAGVVLSLVERTRGRAWSPSAVGVGTAFLIPASYSITLAIGAIGFAILQKRWPAPSEREGTAAAAGGIAGEAIMGIVIAMFTVFWFTS